MHGKIRSLKTRLLGARQQMRDHYQEQKGSDEQKPSRFPIKYKPQIHELQIRRFFEQEGYSLFSEPHTPLKASKVVVVCFINRSGSNWLCESLHATNLCSHGDEFFNDARLKATCTEHNIRSLDEYIHKLFDPKHQTNGTVSMKLSWDQLFFLTKERVIPEILQNAEFVYPVRRDMAAQALSLLIAEQTGQWRSDWNSGINKKPNPDAISDAAILRSIDRIAESHAYFLQYFGVFGIHPHMMFYEDLLANPEQQMDQLLVSMGLAKSGAWSFDSSKQVMKKQATSKNSERLEKFRNNMYSQCG